jgi:hypothetical protein
MMKTTHLVVSAFLSLIAAAASAATTDLGAGAFATTADQSNQGEFSDVYNFSLGSAGGVVSGALIETRAPGSIDIDWGDVPAIRIFGGLDATGPTLFIFGGPYDPALTVNFSQLAVPAQFSIAISGRAIGGGGGDAVPPVLGEYRLEVAVAAVPEPGTWAMMFGGLGVLGWAGLRRQVRVALPLRSLG